jgi:hypothetical protein
MQLTIDVKDSALDKIMMIMNICLHVEKREKNILRIMAV